MGWDQTSLRSSSVGSVWRCTSRMEIHVVMGRQEREILPGILGMVITVNDEISRGSRRFAEAALIWTTSLSRTID